MDLSTQEPVRMGRPSAYTPALVDKLIGLIQEGNPIRAACAVCQISQDTYNRWIRYDREGDLTYQGFADRVAEARAKAQIAIAEHWRNAIPTDYKVARDYLRSQW